MSFGNGYPWAPRRRAPCRCHGRDNLRDLRRPDDVKAVAPHAKLLHTTPRHGAQKENEHAKIRASQRAETFEGIRGTRSQDARRRPFTEIRIFVTILPPALSIYNPRHHARGAGANRIHASPPPTPHGRRHNFFLKRLVDDDLVASTSEGATTSERQSTNFFFVCAREATKGKREREKKTHFIETYKIF